MGLSGVLIGQIEIKSDGDLFHELFRYNPHKLDKITPVHIQGCELHEGEFGKVGAVLFWKYFHDGKDGVAKHIIEAIDEEKKSVTFNVLEGDVMEQYKYFKGTVHVETTGERNLVTWTIQYEKLNESVPHPTSLLNFFLTFTEAVETHHLKQ